MFREFAKNLDTTSNEYKLFAIQVMYIAAKTQNRKEGFG